MKALLIAAGLVVLAWWYWPRVLEAMVRAMPPPAE
jgi:hypothetical protein